MNKTLNAQIIALYFASHASAGRCTVSVICEANDAAVNWFAVVSGAGHRVTGPYAVDDEDALRSLRDIMFDRCKKAHIDLGAVLPAFEAMMKEEIEAVVANSDDAAELLRFKMREISEAHYAAGWLGGLEFDLWNMVCGGDREWGMGSVSEADVAELQRLSKASGGWWRWQPGGEAFVEANVWAKLCADKQAAK